MIKEVSRNGYKICHACKGMVTDEHFETHEGNAECERFKRWKLQSGLSNDCFEGYLKHEYQFYRR